MRGLEAEVRERPPAPAPPAQRVQAGLVDKCCVSSVRRLRGLLLAPPLCRALRSTGAGEGRRDAFGDRALSGQVRKTLRGRDRRPPFRTHTTLGCATLWLRLPLPNFAWLMAQPEGQTRELLSYQFQFMGR